MFRSRRSFNSYYGKRRQNQRFSNLWILLSIPVFLILLELLTRTLVALVGQSSELSTYQGEPSEVTAYRLKFLNEQLQPYDGLSPRGNLVAQRNPIVGYQLAPRQNHRLWQINDQGFRDSQPITLKKPQDEIRIFILGGSTAFGQGSQSNQGTIAGQLQTRINARVAQQQRSPEKYQPDFIPFYLPERIKALALPPKIRAGKYRIINAAVPGYTSGNQLAQLTLQILPYKPDLIIVLNGYSDLMLPSSETATEIPHLEEFLNNATIHFATYLGKSIQDFVKNTYLVKALEYWILKPEPTLAQRSLVVSQSRTTTLTVHLPDNEEEIKQRLERYRNHHKQMVSICAGAGIPLVIALQPEITSLLERESDGEQEIIEALEPDYIQTMQENYPLFSKVNQKLAQTFPKNVKNVDFYQSLAQLLTEDGNFTQGEAVFTDTIHLTDQVNRVIANQLYQTVTTLPKIQVIPENSGL